MMSTTENVKVKAQLHLRLSYHDWTTNFKALESSEVGVLYAIRTLDPFGDRELEINCTQLGEDLGLHRTTVSRALRTLSKRKLIEIEIVRARVRQRVRNRSLTLLANHESGNIHEPEEDRAGCAPTHPTVRPRTQPCAHAPNRAPTHPSTAETLSGTGFQKASYSYIQNTYNNRQNIETKPVKRIKSAAAEKILIEEELNQEVPSEEELNHMIAEIRRLSPEIEINSQVKKCLTRFWANFSAAVAYVKKAISDGWCKRPTGLLIKSLKNLPEAVKCAAANVSRKYPHPNLEQLNQLAEIGDVEMLALNTAGYPEVAAVKGIVWWDVLGLSLETLCTEDRVDLESTHNIY